jgi:hypothetical protein
MFVILGPGIVQESHEHPIGECVLRGGFGEGVGQALGYIILVEPPPELLALLLLALAVADPVGCIQPGARPDRISWVKDGAQSGCQPCVSFNGE